MTKRASTMTEEQIQEILEGMDWTEIHKARVFSDYGDSIVLYTDSEFSVQGQGTHYRDPDGAGVIGYLSCWGWGNIDRTFYSEGWTELVRDSERAEWDDEAAVYRVDGVEADESDYIVTGVGYEDDEIFGSVITEDRMIEICINDGDWAIEYEEWQDAIIENMREERRYREAMNA